jgi:hypothetical protein
MSSRRSDDRAGAMRAGAILATILTIPTLSAGGLSRFRIALGAGLVLLLASERPTAVPLSLHRSYSVLADWAPIHAIAASQAAWSAVH